MREMSPKSSWCCAGIPQFVECRGPVLNPLRSALLWGNANAPAVDGEPSARPHSLRRRKESHAINFSESFSPILASLDPYTNSVFKMVNTSEF